MFKGIIYRYHIISDRGLEMSYVGQTCSEKQRRADFLNIRGKYSGKRIDNARKKYGPQAFSYEILENIEADSIEEVSSFLNISEIYYIKKYDSLNNGYNNTLGGGGANGYLHTEEYKRKQSQITKKLAENPEYRNKIAQGIKSYYEMNPEARSKKSEEVKKRYDDPKAREKTGLAHKKSYAENPDRAKKQGKKLSETCSTPEGRKRMSETIKNAWKTKEYRDKYSKSKKALWATEKYREKMAIAYKGINGKRVDQLTLDDIKLNEFESATEAGRQLGISRGGISRVCRGERLQYKGFHWKYVNKE